MGFARSANEMYMMPAVFGPCGGPRRTPEGGRFIYRPPMRNQAFMVLAEVEDPAQLAALLPPGMRVRSPHILYNVQFFSDVAWLGGRGYTVLTANIPITAQYDSTGTLSGWYQAVNMENCVDPVLTGREQLGYGKIPVDRIDKQQSDEGVTIVGEQYENEFIRIEVDLASPAQDADALFGVSGGGYFNSGDVYHYKYMPRAEPPFTEPAVNCICVSPVKVEYPADYQPHGRESVTRTGAGGFAFPQEITWEKFPCRYRLFSALAQIRTKRFLGGSETISFTNFDGFNQRVVHAF